jgi:hypothetical protein
VFCRNAARLPMKCVALSTSLLLCGAPVLLRGLTLVFVCFHRVILVSVCVLGSRRHSRSRSRSRSRDRRGKRRSRSRSRDRRDRRRSRDRRDRDRSRSRSRSKDRRDRRRDSRSRSRDRSRSRSNDKDRAVKPVDAKPDDDAAKKSASRSRSRSPSPRRYVCVACDTARVVWLCEVVCVGRSGSAAVAVGHVLQARVPAPAPVPALTKRVSKCCDGLCAPFLVFFPAKCFELSPRVCARRSLKWKCLSVWSFWQVEAQVQVAPSSSWSHGQIEASRERVLARVCRSSSRASIQVSKGTITSVLHPKMVVPAACPHASLRAQEVSGRFLTKMCHVHAELLSSVPVAGLLKVTSE